MLESFFNKVAFNATSAEEQEREEGGGSSGGGSSGGGSSGNGVGGERRRSCFDQSMTPLQWLVYEYPKMKRKHRPFLFVVHPGEVVWIPDDWPHVRIILLVCVHTLTNKFESGVSSSNINLVHSKTHSMTFSFFFFFPHVLYAMIHAYIWFFLLVLFFSLLLLQATVNIDDVFYVHKGSCADQRGARANRPKTHLAAVQRTCRKTGRFCSEYCHAGGMCSKCHGYEDVVCNVEENVEL